MRSFFLALLLAVSGTAVAEATENPQGREIPTSEKEFVETINGFDKAAILAQFGEPSKMDDVKTNTGRVVASIWHYHFLNTNEDGAYYETTELDFVDDKVVMVVFMNNDGEDRPVDAAAPAPAELEPKL